MNNQSNVPGYKSSFSAHGLFVDGLSTTFLTCNTCCIFHYSSKQLEIINSLINLLHFLILFFINILSAFVIIVLITRLHSFARKHNYQQQLRIECSIHKQLLINPVILIVLSFLSGCMKSMAVLWLDTLSHLSHSVVFILPSEVYRNELGGNFGDDNQSFRRCIVTDFNQP